MQALSERLDAEVARRHARGGRAARVLGAEDGGAVARLARRRARCSSVGRDAKYLILDFGDAGRILIHLSQAGRLDVEEPPKRTRAKGSVVRLRFSNGKATLLVREYGHERKAAWWVLAPGDDGPLRTARSRARLRRVRRADPPRRRPSPRPHAAARPAHGRRASAAATPTTRCGARSCRRTRRSRRSTTTSARALLDAVRGVLADGLELERGRTGGLSKPKLGEHFEVHAALRHAVPALRRDVAPRELREPRGHVLPEVPDRRQGPRRPPHVAPRQVANEPASAAGLYAVSDASCVARYQPREPGPPLNGPTTFAVIQPP